MRSGGRKNREAFEANSIRKNPSRNSNMAAAMLRGPEAPFASKSSLRKSRSRTT